jgi:hypothetical protein
MKDPGPTTSVILIEDLPEDRYLPKLANLTSLICRVHRER